MPTKKDGKEILRCTKCKYEMEVKKEEKSEYSVVGKGKSEKVLTTSIVSENNSRDNKDELEQEREEYYREVGLELLRDELEGADDEGGES